jgi:hypothetical protein
MAENRKPKDEQEMTDRPDQALESGEQHETGRSRGRLIDEDGGSASGPAADKSAAKPDRNQGPHWESGRQQAQ